MQNRKRVGNPIPLSSVPLNANWFLFLRSPPGEICARILNIPTCILYFAVYQELFFLKWKIQFQPLGCFKYLPRVKCLCSGSLTIIVSLLLCRLDFLTFFNSGPIKTASPVQKSGNAEVQKRILINLIRGQKNWNSRPFLRFEHTHAKKGFQGIIKNIGKAEPVPGLGPLKNARIYHV